MSYQSPIDVVMGSMKTSYENGVFKAIQNAGIYVDKNELLKALQYDRGQYQKGYADRDSDIIRCRDCKYRDPEDGICDSGHGIRWNLPRPDDWFCADGKRREDNG